MNWEKLGLVFDPTGRSAWMAHTALTPTPLVLGDRIRVFAGFRDVGGVSRIGWVDVDAKEPTRVLAVSETPALDVGGPGTFDDNGVILGDVVRHDGALHLFYVGFQLVQKAKFIALSGHAISDDDGRTFSRTSRAPFAGRSDEGLFCRAIHTARRTERGWHFVYSAGTDWFWKDGVAFPRYEIFEVAVPDGAAFPAKGTPALGNSGEEYRIGRPRLVTLGGSPFLTFTAGTPSGSYRAGMARRDGEGRWQRCDAELGLELSPSGWDARHLCYPAIVTTAGGDTLCFYNGNDMGRAGFGVARLTKE